MLRNGRIRLADHTRKQYHPYHPAPARHQPMMTKGSMRGGQPRIYYGWMRPGSDTRRRWEKMRNPFIDIDNGQSLYYKDTKDQPEAQRAEADANGVLGGDTHMDLYSQYRVIPDLYPEGFTWKHKLNTEYNQWRSNTWGQPELIPESHRGRFLCNFEVNVVKYDMRQAKFSPTDSRQWIACTLYVGTGKGIAGAGQGVGPTAMDAKKEAIRTAFENIIAVNLEDEGPTYPMRHNYTGMRLNIYPCRTLVGSLTHIDCFCALGFQRGGIKINNHPNEPCKNFHMQVLGIFEMFAAMRSTTEMAHMRGKIPHSLVSNMFPYMEEIRRRKGMFRTQPNVPNSEYLLPNRHVDNRMPDHLKKGYYTDKKWKDFFSGSKKHLTEPKLGLRSDQLRSNVPLNVHLSGDRDAPRMPPNKGPRRVLADVLNKMNKSVHELGTMPVSNPFLDEKVTTHAKMHFHLH